ncbi:MAG TPA: hypothetical protein VEL74_13035, partial [Thermoanaerobaculia bacterium]|nr:hypothetical protein [Thermoanaerobaculia bacterium]
GWNIEAGELAVTPLEPVESSLAVEVTLTGEPRDGVTAPLLAPRGASRALWFAKALAQGDGLLELEQAGATREPVASETAALPQAFRDMAGATVAVTDPARPPRWQAVWAEGTDVLAVQVDRLLVDVALGKSGRASYQLWAEVRNRGAQQLVLTLPAGFELAEGRRDGLPVAPGLAPAAGHGFAVPLRTAEEAQVIHLTGVLPLTWPEGDGDLAVPLPALSAPAARVEVRVVLPGRRTYTLPGRVRWAARLGP